MAYQPISEYGIVGNDDRCALVATSGSIDWCCFPTVDSPSVFGRLLDAEDGGHFSVEPTDTYHGDQSYEELTNVLETTFETSSGRATLVDFLPTSSDEREPPFQNALHRHLECEEGKLTVQVDFKPRLDYARAETTVNERDQRIVAKDPSGTSLNLQWHGPVEMRPKDGRAVGTVTLEAGDSVRFALQYDHFEPRSASECQQIYEDTRDYWREWAADVEKRAREITDDAPWLEEVVRSALVLKLLTNEDSGAIYAAATTSLPEEYGEPDNWDYRYNWLRDAKFTVQGLYSLGQEAAAHQYFEWFREIGHEDPETIQPVYGTHGERDLTEKTLDHLDGYRFSTPVRTGNAAYTQRQLDVYGTIVQGLYETLLHDGKLSREDWQSIRTLVDHVCEVWDERGHGIWEFRETERHYVHSKLLCWVALDRGIELAEHHDETIDTAYWEEEREAIREAIEQRGYSESVGSFVQHFETDETLDATCLLIPLFEFLPPEDERVQSTIDTITDELLTDHGLVHRTKGPDVPEEGPGVFLFCSFWLVDVLVMADRIDEAREVFTNVLDHLDAPYLLSERINPSTGEFFGNFPQAFSHIGLINSAIYLGSAAGDETFEGDPLSEDTGVDPLFRR